MKLEDATISEVVRTGGLEHLSNTVEALSHDFCGLDKAIASLMETLRISRPEVRGEQVEEPPARSLIEHITREVTRLQAHSEHQRDLIEWLREQVQ